MTIHNLLLSAVLGSWKTIPVMFSSALMALSPPLAVSSSKSRACSSEKVDVTSLAVRRSVNRRRDGVGGGLGGRVGAVVVATIGRAVVVSGSSMPCHQTDLSDKVRLILGGSYQLYPLQPPGKLLLLCLPCGHLLFSVLSRSLGTDPLPCVGVIIGTGPEPPRLTKVDRT